MPVEFPRRPDARRQPARIAAKAPAMSGADRVAKHVSERNEVGEIPPPRHPRLKARCKYNLELFGWMYCRRLLKHRASPDIKAGLVEDAQRCVLNGGQAATLFPRGGGKTTWIDIIAPVWAMLYGHRRFPVVIGASIKAAKKNLKTIKKLLARSPEILADFPAVAIPVRAIGGVAQRCASQTYKGRATDIEWGSDQITLPTLRDDSGAPLDAGCGAIVAVAGVGGAIRGANEGGQRPDMLLIDDPQTKKAAASPKSVKDILDYIHSDALALAGHDTTIAAFLTITPQRFGDVATEIAAQDKYPEWSVKVQPFIKTLPQNWERLVALYVEQYAMDAAAKDYARPRSTAWYRENAALFAAMETIDPAQFDAAREIDVKHHLLNLRAKLGKTAFDAEIMMSVSDAASEVAISPDIVAGALNGAPRGVCPPGTDTVVAFSDVNIRAGAGLSWVIVAFGPSRVAAVIDYGRYPADGSPLVPPNSSDLVRNRRVAAAIREIVNTIATRRIRDAKGRAVRVRALGFDRGWLPDVVHRALYVIRKRVPVGFPIVAMRGFPWNKFGTRAADILRRGDHVFATRSRYGEYLAYMAPYWREIQQASWLETPPLMPGSLSLFGRDSVAHTQFAAEICAEKLVRKYQAYGGRETTTAWDWLNTGPEHYCDAATGAFALASWFRAYDALSQTIDAAALGVKSPADAPHQPDLFAPLENPALLSVYDGLSDETEGTLDPGTARHPSEADLEADLEDGLERPDFPAPPRPAPRAKKPLFKRGKWRK